LHVWSTYCRLYIVRYWTLKGNDDLIKKIISMWNFVLFWFNLDDWIELGDEVMIRIAIHDHTLSFLSCSSLNPCSFSISPKTPPQQTLIPPPVPFEFTYQRRSLWKKLLFIITLLFYGIYIYIDGDDNKVEQVMFVTILYFRGSYGHYWEVKNHLEKIFNYFSLTSEEKCR